MLTPAFIPLQQRHQKHLKIAPEARAPCQLSCCPLPAPPLCCCSGEARSSLAHGAAGMGPAGESHTGSRSQGMAAAFLPGSSPSTKGHQGVSVPAPLHLSLRRAGGPTYVTTGCPQQEGDTELSERWETPVVEILQPGAVSYFFAEEWRGEAPGEGPKHHSMLHALLHPITQQCSCQKHYQDVAALI